MEPGGSAFFLCRRANAVGRVGLGNSGSLAPEKTQHVVFEGELSAVGFVGLYKGEDFGVIGDDEI